MCCPMKPTVLFHNFEQVHIFLNQFQKTPPQVEGEWDAFQHLFHCAKSIDYSMMGYPLEKPKIMQMTIGQMAFHWFKARGFTRHNTLAITPGGIAVKPGSILRGIELLRSSMVKFDNWTEQLYPHEFYGKLSKKNFALVHCMHIANHFESFRFV